MNNLRDSSERSVEECPFTVANEYPPSSDILLEEHLNVVNKEKINELKNIFISKCDTESDINEHLPTLYEYATQCESILECGVRGCVSSFAFAYGILNNNKPIKRLTLNDIIECNIETLVNIIKYTDIKLDFQWKNDLELEIIENYDMVFIDTLHVYGQLIRELNKFGKVTNKYIIMHDTTVDEVYGEIIRASYDANLYSNMTGFPLHEINCGLGKAIDEFLLNNPEWKLLKKYTNNNGLTILEKQY